MLASARSAKPKLTLSVNVAASTCTASVRPTLSLKSPLTPLRSPAMMVPSSPTAYNTKMNQQGFSTMQQPTYAYPNYSTARSILKKGSSPSGVRRQLQFSEQPQVLCFSPIEDASYYGDHKKMSREERRWISRS